MYVLYLLVFFFNNLSHPLPITNSRTTVEHYEYPHPPHPHPCQFPYGSVVELAVMGQGEHQPTQDVSVHPGFKVQNIVPRVQSFVPRSNPLESLKFPEKMFKNRTPAGAKHCTRW
jgi:hypothetical protein